MLVTFCLLLIIGMRRRFAQRAPFGRPFFPGLLAGVVLGTIRLAVSKLPPDVSLHTTEAILRLHGDPASCS